MTPAATAAAAEDEKKGIDPKIFLVVGLLIGAIIIGGFTTGIFGGSKTPDLPVLPSGPTETISGGPAVAPVAPPPVIAPPMVSPPSGSDSAGTPPQAATFKTVVPPDPRYSNGTMAILPNTPTMSSAEASTMAKYARQMFAPGGRWTTMQVLVFNDPTAAKAFQKYQAPRKGAKLDAGDYQALASQGVWSGVSAYLETKSKSDAGQVSLPSANPNGWWAGNRR